MQTSRTKPAAQTTKKTKQTERLEDTPLTSRKRADDEKRRKIDSLITPRNYGQAASPSDIYGQKKNITKAPKKTGTTSVSKESPMRNALKSSASSVSQMSNYSAKTKIIPTTKQPSSVNKVPNTKKPLINTNVTVNSPLTKRKLDLTTTSGGSSKNVPKRTVEKSAKGNENNDGRQRSKTRTLNEEEVKVLTPENVDNNEEMRKLSQRFKAEPKAFYVNLSDDEQKTSKSKTTAKSQSNTEEDYSDDFESYESDFESYKSETSSNEADNAETSDHSEGHVDETDDKSKRDEERMLDSGSFDLRDAQRSANKSKSILDDILESSSNVEDKRSLTDEGFQEMSGSANSSMRHDALDGAPFMDFEKTKTNRKRVIESRRLKQRANDILSMVTLHEMCYSLFEFHPIPYDVYMTTFGRNNYTQRATQTFDDGITVDIQTDEIITETKWTQNPVDFSKNCVCLDHNENIIRKTKSETDFLCKFTFLLENDVAVRENVKDTDDNYKENPLRIYLEQKDGVGSNKIMEKDKFDLKIKNPIYNQGRLKKFLQKIEKVISSILNLNAGNTLLNETLPSFLPFSRGYSNLFDRTQKDLQFLKNKPITRIVFSKTKSSLFFSVHCDTNKKVPKKSIACLWDISVASRTPLKILSAIDYLELCLFTGNYDGIFVGSLKDGSIHVWDLSEEPSTVNVVSEKETTETVEMNTKGLTQFEIDREWNFRNSELNYNMTTKTLQSSVYTSSYTNLSNGDAADSIVGLQFLNDKGLELNEYGKILCQLCSLQKMGILTLWLVIQEKTNSKQHPGKAMWSKIHLERTQTINLMENFENTIKTTKFDLQTAKKRLSLKKKSISRPKSAVSNSSFKSDSLSVASDKKSTKNGRNDFSVLPASWDSGIVCTDLKVVNIELGNLYLVAKNCGEVLLCRKSAGCVAIDKLFVATDRSTITCLETSLLNLPYFLAGTDTGTIHLCSLVDHRVLLTLDNSNAITHKEESSAIERCHGDMKGRYLGSIPVKPHGLTRSIDHCISAPSISSIEWSVDNPCHIYTLSRDGAASVWDLTFSDINCKAYFNEAAVFWTCFDGGMGYQFYRNSMYKNKSSYWRCKNFKSEDLKCKGYVTLTEALITKENVQIHKTSEDKNKNNNVEIFSKYIKLL